MFVRFRWFLLGLLVALGSGAFVMVKLVRMRERLTPANVGKATALAAADVIEWAARRLSGETTHR